MTRTRNSCQSLANGTDARAQNERPPAYILVEFNITDPDGFQAYTEKVPATIAQHGGAIFAYAEAEMIEGAAPEGRVIILRFGKTADARSWLNSPEYLAIKGIRHQAG